MLISTFALNLLPGLARKTLFDLFEALCRGAKNGHSATEDSQLPVTWSQKNSQERSPSTIQNASKRK
jgi:hypothetical protein